MRQISAKVYPPGPAIGTTDPYKGPKGTILIARETFNDTRHRWAMDEILRTYAHELGNLLDQRPNSAGNQNDFGRTYGDPKSAIDTDTGQAIEDCLFGPVR